MVKNKLVWTRRSQQHVPALYKYISDDSPQNAVKVVNDIIAAVEKAINNPKFYGPDKFKMNNDGSYRAFERNIVDNFIVMWFIFRLFSTLPEFWKK